MKRVLVVVPLALGGLVIFVYGRSESMLEAPVPAPSPVVFEAVDAAGLARGEHLAESVLSCGLCHGDDLGGAPMVDDGPTGRLWAPNLTRGAGGFAATATPTDWMGAIRFGRRADGRSLALMPSAYHASLADGDVAAIVAWIERLPPVDRTVPARRVGWLTRTVLAFGLADDLLSARGARPATARAVQESLREEGERLVDLANCRVCHGPDLRGGLHPLALPDEPTPPDLRPGGALADWTRSDFGRALREGRTPDGRQLDPAYMPWPRFAGLSDRELDALWQALRPDTIATSRHAAHASR
ncbi:MAG: c-type cytochrome [Myxococcota bacterium]